MATHSSVLAWRIPGMGEPGGLPSMGSHRVRHDWSDLAAAANSKRACWVWKGTRTASRLVVRGVDPARPFHSSPRVCGLWVAAPQARARKVEGTGREGSVRRAGHRPGSQDCETTQTHQLSSLSLPLREGPPRGGHAGSEGPVWIQSPNLQVWAPGPFPPPPDPRPPPLLAYSLTDPLRRELGAQPDWDKDGGAAWENKAPFPLNPAASSRRLFSPALETQPPPRPPASPPPTPGPASAISKPRTQKCMKLRALTFKTWVWNTLRSLQSRGWKYPRQ